MRGGISDAGVRDGGSLGQSCWCEALGGDQDAVAREQGGIIHAGGVMWRLGGEIVSANFARHSNLVEGRPH